MHAPQPYPIQQLGWLTIIAHREDAHHIVFFKILGLRLTINYGSQWRAFFFLYAHVYIIWCNQKDLTALEKRTFRCLDR